MKVQGYCKFWQYKIIHERIKYSASLGKIWKSFTILLQSLPGGGMCFLWVFLSNGLRDVDWLIGIKTDFRYKVILNLESLVTETDIESYVN